MPQTLNEKYEKLKLECSANSFHSFAYSYIFDRRSRKYGMRLRLLKVFGILVPSTLGALVLSYQINKDAFEVIKFIAATISLIQFVFSIFAVCYEWDNELAYAYESSQDYSNLSTKFDKLFKFPPEDFDDFDRQHDLINTEYSSRNHQTSKHNISEKERRFGMRWALRQFQWNCIRCEEIPFSMKSTDCEVCGNLKFYN